MLVTKIKRLDPKAEMPVRETDGSAGYDIKFLRVDKIVDDVIYFGTGLAIQAPEGHYYELAPRSSISKLPLSLANSIGKIDEDYRGEILVPIRVLHENQGNGPQHGNYAGGIVRIFDSRPPTMLAVANRILLDKPHLVQLILKKRLETEWEEVNQLDETDRGDGGFGSTDARKARPKKPQVRESVRRVG